MPVTGTYSVATLAVACASGFLTISSNTPSYTIPFVASTVIIWPSLMDVVASWLRLLVPTIQGIPSSRLTIDAWQVIPPASVTIAFAFFIAGTQSGAVIAVTRISPSLNSSISSGLMITWALPAALPGEAGKPFTIISRLPASNVLGFSVVFGFSLRDQTVSGRACKIQILPSRSSTPHSISM